MKRHLLRAVALALLPTAVHAQGATAPVTVTVQTDATLTRTGMTTFGTIGSSARTVTIDPRFPASDHSTAMFTAVGTPHANVVVTFDATTNLCHQTSGCAQKIEFTPHVIEAAQNGWQSFNATDVANDGIVRLNPDGTRYFWLGGSITTTANQPTGLYSGLFTMRIVFQ
jgi:Domain of unknown function (DUF4402)